MLKLQPLSTPEVLATVLALATAAVSPLAFAWSATGAVSFHTLGVYAVAPALVLWSIIAAGAGVGGWKRLASAAWLAIVAGVLGTAVMEVVRAIGFRVFQAMPGSLPMLIGVLLTDRFMEGPNWISNLIGWGDHFWNGVGFAFIYITLLGRQRWWMGVIYAMAIATVFMLSPVMDIIGAGYFGQNFAPLKFPLTVYLAHIAYGAAIGWVAQRSRSPSTRGNVLSDLFRWPRHADDTPPLRS